MISYIKPIISDDVSKYLSRFEYVHKISLFNNRNGKNSETELAVVEMEEYMADVVQVP